MNVVSFTKARENLKSVLDQVKNDNDCTIITRKNDENAVVMSLEYYNSLMESLYLMSSPKNAERLNRSIEQIENNQVEAKSLIL